MESILRSSCHTKLGCGVTDELEVRPDIQRHLDTLEKWTERDLPKLSQMQSFCTQKGPVYRFAGIDLLESCLQSWISEFCLDKNQQHALAAMKARPTLGSISSSIIEGIH